MLGQNNVGLFGLLETRIKSSKVQNNIFSSDGKLYLVTNYSHHSGGRIWLIWDSKCFELEGISIYTQCIHMKVRDKSRNLNYWLTMVYGLNQASDREVLWQQLGQISMRISGAWCMMGDFNAISNLNDRI